MASRVMIGTGETHGAVGSMDLAPAVYEHAAALIHERPWVVSRDAQLLCRAHGRAFELYGHSPVVVGIDIYNVEAEAYGATVEEPSGNGIPAITEPICDTTADLCRLPLFDPSKDGRLSLVVETARRLKTEFPEADVRVPVSGPFSIASNLMGFDALLCSVVEEPERARHGLQHLVDGQSELCRAVVQAGLDVAFFESAAAPPLLSPQMFRDVALPPLSRALRAAASIVGHPVPCIMGGDTLPILSDILGTGTGYVICPYETEQESFMAQMAGDPDITVRINMDPGVLASGAWGRIKDEVDRVLALGRATGHDVLGTGALPYETPQDVVVRIREYLAASE